MSKRTRRRKQRKRRQPETGDTFSGEIPIDKTRLVIPPTHLERGFDWKSWMLDNKWDLFDVRSASSFNELGLGNLSVWLEQKEAVMLVSPEFGFKVSDASRGVVVIPRVVDCLGVAIRAQYRYGNSKYWRVLAFHHYAGVSNIGSIRPVEYMINMLSKPWRPKRNAPSLRKGAIQSIETFVFGLNHPASEVYERFQKNSRGIWQNDPSLIFTPMLADAGISAPVKDRLYRVMEVPPIEDRRALANSFVPIYSLALGVETGRALLFQQNVKLIVWVCVQEILKKRRPTKEVILEEIKEPEVIYL